MPAGTYLYIISSDEKLRARPESLFRCTLYSFPDGVVRNINHPCLSNQQPVVSAGRIEIDSSGYLKVIDGSSGHYHPSLVFIRNAISLLTEIKGAIMSASATSPRPTFSPKSPTSLFRRSPTSPTSPPSEDRRDIVPFNQKPDRLEGRKSFSC